MTCMHKLCTASLGYKLETISRAGKMMDMYIYIPSSSHSLMESRDRMVGCNRSKLSKAWCRDLLFHNISSRGSHNHKDHSLCSIGSSNMASCSSIWFLQVRWWTRNQGR